ncbi:restriction endonuclease subunit S [Apilactobacillus kunkeei]|uniref:restriction endonuclease subunit S n=1 Tax=Apilactobacillus kunkeei TaxID=148814 RepID=UPI00200B6B9C|nr:restriction endonuclease subunit S [Apilactobacillus kunkeei]MCK8635902.1 restriction endonuclease subunit S [Apilactobacillus kunkeei]
MTKTKVPRLRFSGFSGEWKEEKLGDVSTNSKGSGLSKESINVDKKGQPVVHYADIYKFNNIVNEVIHWSEKDEGKIIPDNSVIFPMSDVTPNGLAKCSVVNVTRVKAGGDILIFSMNQEISSRYISYFISGNKKKVLKLVSGTSVKHISSKSISKILISFPELNEQQKIGDFFTKLDKLIELQTQKVDQLKKLKRGYLQKMFPQEGETVPRLRFSGFSGEWKEDKLLNFSKLRTGNRNVQDSLDNGKYVFFDRSNEIKLLNEFEFEGKVLVYPGEGAKFLPRKFEGKYSLHQRAYGLYDFKNIDYEFLFQELLTQNRHFLRYSVGTTAKSLRKDCFERLIIKFADFQEQQKIGEFFAKLDKLIEEQSNKLDQLKQQKKAYLQKMFI